MGDTMATQEAYVQVKDLKKHHSLGTDLNERFHSFKSVPNE